MSLDCSGVDNKDIKDFFLHRYPNSTLKVIVFAANGKLCESICFDVFLPLYTTLNRCYMIRMAITLFRYSNVKP